MIWSLFKQTKTPPKILAVIDIGTGSVNAVLAAVPTNGDAPLIFWKHSVKLNFALKPDQKRLLQKVLAGIKEAATALQQASCGLNVQTVQVVLAAPFYRARTNVLSFVEDEPFRLTSEIFTGLAQVEGEAATKQIPKPFSEISGDKPALMEYEVLGLSSNGYKITRDQADLLTHLEVIQYASVSSKVILERFRKAIIGHGHFQEVRFHSFLLSLTRAITETELAKNSFLVLDLAGEKADLGLVSGGILMDQSSIPISSHVLNRLIKNEVGLVSTNILSSKRVQKAWLKPKATWQNAVMKSLERFSHQLIVPKKVYAIADEPSDHLFLGALQELGLEPIILSQMAWQEVCGIVPNLKYTDIDSALMAEVTDLAQIC